MAWVEHHGIGVQTTHPFCSSNRVLSLQSPGVPPPYFVVWDSSEPFPAPGVWVSIPIGDLPSDVVAVELAGFLIITPGVMSQAPDLAVAFQAPNAGFDPPVAYCAQALGSTTTGARTNFNITCPVRSSHFEFAWLRGEAFDGSWPVSPIPPHPLGAMYGINVAIQKYIRA